MKYSDIHEGIFLERPNRFIAWVQMDGRREKVHVKNTGRCRELLQEGAQVWLEKSANPSRSTAYDLVTVRKGDRLVNMGQHGAEQSRRGMAESGRPVSGCDRGAPGMHLRKVTV